MSPKRSCMMNPPAMYSMYGIPGVTHVLDELQKCVCSTLRSEKSSFLLLPLAFSIEKLYFGFLERYPRKIAAIFFSRVSSKSSKIFSWFDIAITLRIKFTNNGTVDSMAAFVKVVKGVIMFPDAVMFGASAANAINPRASAPPNIPILQITRAIGAMISDIPRVFNAFV